MLRAIVLILGLVALFCAGVGVEQWGVGSAHFHTFPIGVFLLGCAMLIDGGPFWTRKQ